MKSLVLAEKPSVARDIARVLNCSKKYEMSIGRGQVRGYLGSWASCNFGGSGGI